MRLRFFSFGDGRLPNRHIVVNLLHDCSGRLTQILIQACVAPKYRPADSIEANLQPPCNQDEESWQHSVLFPMRHPTISPTFATHGISAVVTLLSLVAVAHADVWQGFEEAETSWQLAEADGQVQTLVHERTWREAHGGNGSEHFRLALGAGNKVLLSTPVPPARAIQELRLALWVKADRVGPQLFARVVLPRSREPRTDRPLTMLIAGSSIARAGEWQMLSIADVPALVERQARVLRSQLGPAVDTREAYVDMMIVNAYSEPGMVQLWLDDLEVTGHVAFENVVAGDATGGQVRQAAFDANAGLPSIRLDGSIILLDGKPQQLRMIEHNGESLEWLRSVGFNGVLLKEPATPELLTDAQRLGIQLIAPPPREEDRLSISAAHAPVIAWMIGERLGYGELETTRSVSKRLRVADNAAGRPLIASAIGPLSAYSRTASLLFVEPPPLGGSFEMADYAAWFAERPRLARAGTPMIALLSSEPTAAATAQFDALQPSALLPHTLDYEQLRLLTFTAVASGVRGVCFRSQTRLDGQGAAAQQRADMLKLLNSELRLVEPWMAAGSHTSEVDNDDPQVRISALQTERARLLIVRRYLPNQQWVLPPTEKDRVSLIMPGTPSSTHAYRLSTLGMEPLLHKRVTGGTHIAIESAGVCSMIVLTQDPLVLNRVARDLAALESQQSKLHYDIVARKVETTEQAVGGIPDNAFPTGSRALAQATVNLQQALRLIAANDRRGAEKYIVEADRQASVVQYGQWQFATQAFASAVESPLCTNFAMLPAHYEVADRLKVATWSENVLAGGDMERLEALMQAGWRHMRDPNVALESLVELAPQAHSGQSSLHLAAFAGKQQEVPTIVETPPVWVTTPAIAVGQNKMLRIRGYVRTSAAISGSHDGVMIFDSIGGQSLATRVKSSEPWRQFTHYRVVPADANLTVTIALTGIGHAWIDDLDIAVLDLPRARPQPSRAPRSVGDAPEEIAPPRVRAEELPPPQARGWWPRLR